MSQDPDEASLPGRPVWQRPDWRILERPLSPKEQSAAYERQLGAYVSRLEEMASALEEAKHSGHALVLRCISPLSVPTVLECLGIDYLQNLYGDFEITGAVDYQEGWWTYQARMGYEWDPREEMWEYGQDLVQEVFEESEIDLLPLADLLLHAWMGCREVIPVVVVQ